MSKILFLLNSLTMGGSERKTVRLANHLAQRSHNVTVAYLNGPTTLASEVDPAITLVCLGRTGKFSFGALIRLARLARDSAADTVVAVNLYPALYAVLLKCIPAGNSLVVVASVNTTEFATDKESRQMAFYRHVLRHCDLLIFGAMSQQQLWKDRYHLGNPEPPTIVLHNGVDTDFFRREVVSSARGNSWPRASFIAGTVGKLRIEKAQHHLLEAVALLRHKGIDAGAVIVGDGPQMGLLQATVERLQLRDYVLFAGEVADVRAYLAGFDAFVLPSVAVETFSNAALEAMSMGCPVISADVGGMREMLGFGGGYLYEPGDIESLVLHLETLAASPQSASAIAEQARRAAVEHFSWQRMTAEFTQDVLASGWES